MCEDCRDEPPGTSVAPRGQSLRVHGLCAGRRAAGAAELSTAPHAADAHTRALLEAPLVPTLLRFAAPNLGLALMQALVSGTDTWFVGRLGTDALGGLALVFPLIMLMQMMSAGAMGGGVSSSIARALGAGDVARAERLAMHALVIAVGFGLLFSAVLLAAGPGLYALLGGSDAALTQAVTYSTVLFGGAIAVWLCNILASIVRGTGNMRVPAAVLSATAALQIPLCGALVFGWGPFPAFGIAGAAVAYVCSFSAGALCLAAYLLAGRGRLRLRPSAARFSAPLFGDILSVGLLSSFNAVQTVATAVIVTGFVGAFGTAALAGFGLGVRLELLQVPVVFALGSALVAMIGTCVGAGDLERARRVAWAGAGLAACITGSVGLTVALFPRLWAGLFSADPDVLDAGTTYLRIIGPCYAFLGIGVALYFASQGAGRVLWVVLAGSARFVIAVAGGFLLLHTAHASPAALFVVIGAAMCVFGIGAAAAVKWRVWPLRQS